MSNESRNRIVLMAMACLAVGVTGCCLTPGGSTVEICPENVKARLPSIVCQPLDTEFYKDQASVDLSVNAEGKNLAFQWFYRAPGTIQDVPVTDRADFKNVTNSTLTIAKPSKANIGYYYCEIFSVDDAGFPTRTDTRLVSLGYGGGRPKDHAFLSFEPPEQSVPTPGKAQTSPCGTSYTSEVTFPLGGGTAALTTNATESIQVVLVTPSGATNDFPSSNAQIYIQDTSANKPPFCAKVSGAYTWSFAGTATHYYRYAVYFDNGKAPSPTLYPHVQFIVLP
jgi:hypothetical protein